MEISESPAKDRRYEALGNLRVLPDELICTILENLSSRDVARLSCVSSVMYILCNEEPLWMNLCLKNSGGLLEYKGSWKETALNQLNLAEEFTVSCRKPRQFDGFNSLFLYKRWYRRFTTLSSFSLDNGDLERKEGISIEEFNNEYDGRKPVLLTDLADNWLARTAWTTDKLLQNYGDTAFRLSQRSSRKISMKFKDYVTYIKVQHDEDPLYIFDDKFGEVEPGLLKEYSVPHLFQEDFFDVLERDQRPPFRWLIIGPERSGASWHVDPALTSAWNTLLSGRKRWALYPPGRVPLGVTVHVNEEDGDINIESPSSLQWWLDFYPLLADHDKPLECTQLPGETIFVPSGWWHCVLNIDTTVAVTQNFVNTSNFEFVCLDMAPGHLHKGLSRAGMLAIHDNDLGNAQKDASCDTDEFNFPDTTHRKKRLRVSEPSRDSDENTENSIVKSCNGIQNCDFSYDIGFLSKYLEEDKDHYTSIWSSSNCIGQREMREWLHKLWVFKPGMRELIWKGASLALNVEKWSACMAKICACHSLPPPLDDERFPVGTGSNPVYLLADHVIKIYVEGGLESAIHGLGTELEFYNLLHKVKSPLRDHIPNVLASGILFRENGSYKTVSWDGKGVPEIIAKCDLITRKCTVDGFPLGVWSKKQFEFREAGKPPSINGLANHVECTRIWPYIIIKRCNGGIYAHLRDILPARDVQNLASFLGDQLRNLHLLPLPSSQDPMYSEENHKMDTVMETGVRSFTIPAEWVLFIETMTRRKKDISKRLAQWGDPIPRILIEKVNEYIPHDLAMMLSIFKDKDGLYKVLRLPTWIHSDIMDDNIHMESRPSTSFLDENAPDSSLLVNGNSGDQKQRQWHPSHILDFSDLSIGDPLCDLIPIYLDVFRGDSNLLKLFLESYKLPLARRTSEYDVLLDGPAENGNKFQRISYHAMCYCILHQDNVLGVIFNLWRELRMAKSWEEVEETLWGELNKYEGFC